MHFIAKIIDVLLKHYLNVNSRSELRIATFMRSVRIFFSFDEFTFFNASTVNPPLPPNGWRRITMLVKGSSAAI